MKAAVAQMLLSRHLLVAVASLCRCGRSVGRPLTCLSVDWWQLSRRRRGAASEVLAFGESCRSALVPPDQQR
eukprot:COSAG01_NODE_61749_length_288_cov_0.656085_1_plen_71_part_01